MQTIFPEIKIEAAKSNTKLLVVKSKTQNTYIRRR